MTEEAVLTPIGKFAVFGAALALTLGMFTQFAPVGSLSGAYIPSSGQAGKDVVWVPTPQALVDRMLDMAQVTKDDYVVDLGSGDGRTVITAAKRGVRAHGIEYNPDLVALSKRKAEDESVAHLATFEQADIFESDFSNATVVTLFLLDQLNLRLRPTLLEMKPGTRIVSNTFDMGDWEPDDRIDAGRDCKSWCRAYKWVVPAKVAGEWRLGDDRLQLTQTFQKLSGTLTRGGQPLPLSDARMDGSKISFIVGGNVFRGDVANDTMSGSGPDGSWTATRVAS
jgi:SAM-dependent methyltransferase